MKNPFKPQGDRAKWYYWGAVAILFAYGVALGVAGAQQVAQFLFGTERLPFLVVPVLGYLSVLVLICWRLRIKGTSKSLKQKVV